MYVCLCKAITDHQIRQAACEGACTLRELRQQLGVASQCGRCVEHAKHVLDETLGSGAAESQIRAA